MGNKANLLSGPVRAYCGVNPAAFATAQGSNKDLLFTAVAPNGDGELVSVAYVVAGVSTPLSIAVSGLDITVNLKTTSGSIADSTASEIQAALAASSAAAALVTVTLAVGSDGAGKPTAMAKTNLAITLVDIGYLKGGVKGDVTPQRKQFTVDETGNVPAVEYLNGTEVKAQFSVAEYTLQNIKLAIASAVPLQDDTDPTKQAVMIRHLIGKLITGRKWVFKMLDPQTRQPVSDKKKWFTMFNAIPSDQTVSIAMNIDDLRQIPFTLDGREDANGNIACFGDQSVVDADGSGF